MKKGQVSEEAKTPPYVKTCIFSSSNTALSEFNLVDNSGMNHNSYTWKLTSIDKDFVFKLCGDNAFVRSRVVPMGDRK